MARILLLIAGFLGGCVVGAGMAYGIFQLVDPPPPLDNNGGMQAINRQFGEIVARSNRRMDWLISGSVIGGLIGLTISHFLAKGESDDVRPPADFKIGDPPPK